MNEKFELQLSNGQIVEWEGCNGIDAAQRYENAHPDVTAFAWRHVRFGVFVGVLRIVEPGDTLPYRKWS